MPSNGIIIDSPELDVFGQMAFDEALCEEFPAEFMLRFYRWKSRGATFGYSQRYMQVLAMLEDAEIKKNLVRRPTGGGLVFHDTDITFSFIFSLPGVIYPGEVYSRIHGAVCAGLNGIGVCSSLWNPAPEAVTAGMKMTPEEYSSMTCFKKPVSLDIVDEGAGPACLPAGGQARKILGGAVRRFGDNFLYQGSLRVSGGRDNSSRFEAVVADSLAKDWSVAWQSVKAQEKIIAKARGIEESKYKTIEWNRRI